MRLKARVEIKPIGKEPGSEAHHNLIIVNGDAIGTSDYSKAQDVQVAIIKHEGKVLKRIYRKTTHGVRKAVEEWCFRNGITGA